MDREELITRLKELVSPFLERQNLELIDLISFHQGKRLVIRFLVDKPEGGISLGECAQLNSQLGKFFDEKDIIEGSYVVEVFSPGIDRQLKSNKDFLRNKNRDIELVLHEPVLDKKNLAGRLTQVLDDSIELEINGKLVEIARSNISHAAQKL